MPTKIEVLATLQLVDQSLCAKTRTVAEGEGRVAALEEAVSARWPGARWICSRRRSARSRPS